MQADDIDRIIERELRRRNRAERHPMDLLGKAAKHLDDYVQMVGVLNMESPRDLLPFLGRLGRAISAFEAATSEGTDG